MYAKLAIAAVVAVAVAAIGLSVLWPGQGPSVGGPNPSSSPSLLPSPSPALTARFHSTIHGLSISYPAVWTAAPATQREPTGESGFLNPAADWLYDPELTDHLFIVLGSEQIEGQTGIAWATAVMNDPAQECGVEPESLAVVRVGDGSSALICETLALAWHNDWGYSIRLYASLDDPEMAEVYDRAWFDVVLETVDVPVARP